MLRYERRQRSTQIHGLIEQQKVPCTFELSVPNMGYLQGNPGEDVCVSPISSDIPTQTDLLSQIKQGSKVELPLWLAEMLAVSNPSGNSSLATLDLPQALSQRVMNALKADPKTVDLRAQAQHFYNIGARMLELFEEEEMVDILTDVSSINAFMILITFSYCSNRHSSNVQLKSQTKR